MIILSDCAYHLGLLPASPFCQPSCSSFSLYPLPAFLPDLLPYPFASHPAPLLSLCLVQASPAYFQPSCSSFSLYPSPAFLLVFQPFPFASLSWLYSRQALAFASLSCSLQASPCCQPSFAVLWLCVRSHGSTDELSVAMSRHMCAL